MEVEETRRSISKRSRGQKKKHIILSPVYTEPSKPLLIRCAKRGRRDISLRKILTDPTNLSALAEYVNVTGRLKQTLVTQTYARCFAPGTTRFDAMATGYIANTMGRTLCNAISPTLLVFCLRTDIPSY
ncbi:hypothetical protein BDQ17DRAFT_1409464 [Cyathus striatus]|nr:hypothetical protein BDQ17DRAFT_1409464 [Cyathus striatus]